MKFTQLKSLAALGCSVLLSACSVNEEVRDVPNESGIEIIDGIVLEIPTSLYDNQGPHEHNFTNKRVSGFTEGFESGQKGAYSGGSVSLSSGSWYFNDALIGDLSNDKKFGSQSTRIRNSGYLLMSFDMDNGAQTIRVRHAKYGNDGSSTWRLIVSFDSGNSWFYAGNSITTNTTSLNTVSFGVNETGKVRFGIYKTGGGTNRINIDNFEVTTTTTGGESPTRDSNITFGNPSNAGSSSTNYFLSKPDYTISYNNNLGTANWVSWHLSRAWRGNTPRCNCFATDNSLPSSFFRASSSDYSGSGFDRGHICPSADRTYSGNGNENTFFMTNIAPQAPDNNQRSWADFENYLRSLLDTNEIYIVAGVAGSGGIGRNGFMSAIANGAITVPDSFWKVALILPNGTGDVNRVTTTTRVFAINIPNDQNISTNWRDFRTSIDAIENLTGYDFFENIPNTIESVLESKVGN